MCAAASGAYSERKTKIYTLYKLWSNTHFFRLSFCLLLVDRVSLESIKLNLTIAPLYI